MQPLPANYEHDLWETEEDRDAWMEFVEANKVWLELVAGRGSWCTDAPPQTLNFEYTMDNQPFNKLPWQYSPNPKIDHRPPIFIYGFALSNNLSEIEHMAHATGILKPEEPLTGTNLMSVMPQTLDRIGNGCGRHEKDLFPLQGVIVGP